MTIRRFDFSIIHNCGVLAEEQTDQTDHPEAFITAIQTFFNELCYGIMNTTAYPGIENTLPNSSPDNCESLFENAYQELLTRRQSFSTSSPIVKARPKRHTQQSTSENKLLES